MKPARQVVMLFALVMSSACLAAETKLNVVMFSGSDEYKSTPSLQALA